MRATTLAFAVLSASAATANAEPRRDAFFLRGGPAFASFDAGASVRLAGRSIPGADAKVRNNTGFAFEGGWFFAPDWSVSLTIGVPPTARIVGTGTLAPAGLLGTARYGPAALDIQYNLPTQGPLRPYLGAGFNYTLVYHVRGSAIADLQVSNGNGPLVQAGAEYRVSDHFAIFADLKKIWVAVDGRGASMAGTGTVPARARLELDPVILNGGISWHF